MKKDIKITFLGTGTSTGVPQIGCRCDVCTSTDIRDKRLRASAVIEVGEKRFLIDAGPDFRSQMLCHPTGSFTAILITHSHYDHVGGLDDVRPMGESNIYAEEAVLSVIKRNMPYCFGGNRYPGVPRITLHVIGEEVFHIDNIKITPIRVYHAQLPILGYRIGNVAYLTDVKTIPKEEFEKLKGLDLLVINALRPKTHISHITLEEAIAIAQKIEAKETYFTHMSHDMGLHREVDNHLPKHIHLAYDGLTVS